MSFPNSTSNGTITAAGQSVGLNALVALSVQITGTWVGTLAFEVSDDNATWQAINVVALNGTTTVTTTTANGAWRANVSAFRYARVRASAWTSGTATVSLVGSDAGAPDAIAGLVSQQAAISVSGTLQSAAGATGAGTPLAVLGHSSVTFTVSGTFVGTVTFQGTEDGTNYSSILATRLGTSVIATTATTAGTYEASCAGLQSVQANITAYTSGAITVTAHAVPLPFNVRSVVANPSSGAIVAATTPPTATGAGADTSYTFSSPVRHVIVQNNTGAACYLDFDTAASLGSFEVYPGGQLLVFDVPCTVLHLYTAAAQNINGATAGGFVVRGWS